MAKSPASEDEMLSSTTVFLVGQAEELMIQNTFMLSKSSPVFEAMLYGELKEKNEIKIPDIEPDAFKSMLKFISGEEVTFSNMDHAARVCYAADKYELPSLKRCCAEYIYPRTVDELWVALDCGVLHDIDLLKDGAMKLVRHNTHEVLSSRQFTSLSRDALKLIVQEDQLNINSETELFDAVLFWAKHQCTIAGKPFDRQNFRDTIGDLIKHIRFLKMSQIDVMKYGRSVFTAEEIKVLLKCFKEKRDSEDLDFSCCSTEKRKKVINISTKVPSVVYSLSFSRGNEKYIVASNKIKSQCLKISSHSCPLFSINLHSAIIPTRSILHENSERFYFEDVKITLKTSGNIYATGEYVGKVNYDTELCIPLLTSDKKFPQLSYIKYDPGYELSLTFKAEEIHYYPLRMCSLSSVFTGSSDAISFLIGFEYSK